MDVVLPPHAVKTFCSSIGTLSRIGKDLYLEFEPIDGLVLHTLNDAKSAYACFKFRPTFFERCTAPPETLSQVSRRNNKKRKSSSSQDSSSGASGTQGSNKEEEDKLICRIPLRALTAVVRPRKGVASLRIRSENSFVSFEYQLQSASTNTILTVTHRIPVATETACQRAVAPKENASELVAAPSVWLSLLDPIRSMTEVALIVRNRSSSSNNNNSTIDSEAAAKSSISAASFYHSIDTIAGRRQQEQQNMNNNAILQATSASLVKTETSIGSEEVEDFDFITNRHPDDDVDMPDDVNQQVILVFSVKEAKAMLQFCASQASSNSNNPYANFLDPTSPGQAVSLSFHWGGKPLVLETTSTGGDRNNNNSNSTAPFSAQLVLATLDHNLLASERTMEDPRNSTSGRGTTTTTTPARRTSTSSNHSAGSQSTRPPVPREVSAR